MTDNRKNNIQFHETAKQAAIASYKKNSTPGGYWSLDSIDNPKSGFHAEVFTNGKDIIIAYRGTNWLIGIDGRNDIAMSRGRIPAQATEALQVYDAIKEKYPNIDITVVGHSLGGSLAQIVSAIRGCVAVTFNAYGTKNMFKSGIKLNEANITNYVNENDTVAMSNGENHIGQTYAVPPLKGDAHKAENMDSLSKRTYRTPEELKRNWYRLHPNAAAMQDKLDNYNSRLERNRENMRKWLLEYEDRKREEHSQFKHAYNHNPDSCPGSYYVKGYTRKDGSNVGGYIRDCWLHGN